MGEPIRPFIRAITRVDIGRRQMFIMVDGDEPERVASVLEERVRAYCESESAATLEAASHREHVSVDDPDAFVDMSRERT